MHFWTYPNSIWEYTSSSSIFVHWAYGTAPNWFDNTGTPVEWTAGTTIPSITVPAVDQGAPDPTYAVNGSIPSGITFNSLTREISGILNSNASNGVLTIRATNHVGVDDWTLAYTVIQPEPVITTNTDRIYYRSVNEPNRPTGGMTNVNHTPVGWNRGTLSATETQSVWASDRTRTYSDGVFVSATIWGIVYEFSPRIPATIINTVIASIPTAAVDTYGEGEIIRFVVTFSSVVDITGNPRFPMNLGQSPIGSPEFVDYTGGSGTTELTFEWLVASTDEDTNGVFLYANRSEGVLNTTDGTVRNAGSSINADSDLNILGGTQSGHKVDGSLTPPAITIVLSTSFSGAEIIGSATVFVQPAATIPLSTNFEGGQVESSVSIVVLPPPAIAQSTEITSAPGALSDTYGVDEAIEISVMYNVAVDVDITNGIPTVRANIFPTPGITPFAYQRKNGSATLVFSYTVQASDRDTNGLFLYGNDSNNNGDIVLNGGTIRNADTIVDADLVTTNRGTQSGHKVNGSLSIVGDAVILQTLFFGVEVGGNSSLTIIAPLSVDLSVNFMAEAVQGSASNLVVQSAEAVSFSTNFEGGQVIGSAEIFVIPPTNVALVTNFEGGQVEGDTFITVIAPATVLSTNFQAGQVEGSVSITLQQSIPLPSSGVYRFNSLLVFNGFASYLAGDDAGRWALNLGGNTTPSVDTGPGSNSLGPYIFTETSSATLDEISENSIARLFVVDEWPIAQERILGLRCAIMGDWNSGNEGLAVEGRESGGNWEQIDIISGWSYANDYSIGDTITRYGETDLDICVQDGGWLDIYTAIPDLFTDLRLRSVVTSGTTYLHDIALWSATLTNRVLLSTYFVAEQVDGNINLTVIAPDVIALSSILIGGEVGGNVALTIIPPVSVDFFTDFEGGQVQIIAELNVILPISTNFFTDFVGAEVVGDIILTVVAPDATGLFTNFVNAEIVGSAALTIIPPIRINLSINFEGEQVEGIARAEVLPPSPIYFVTDFVGNQVGGNVSIIVGNRILFSTNFIGEVVEGDTILHITQVGSTSLLTRFVAEEVVGNVDILSVIAPFRVDFSTEFVGFQVGGNAGVSVIAPEIILLSTNFEGEGVEGDVTLIVTAPNEIAFSTRFIGAQVEGSADLIIIIPDVTLLSTNFVGTLITGSASLIIIEPDAVAIFVNFIGEELQGNTTIYVAAPNAITFITNFVGEELQGNTALSVIGSDIILLSTIFMSEQVGGNVLIVVENPILEVNYDFDILTSFEDFANFMEDSADGKWAFRTDAGSTPSQNVGPGSNSAGSYVFTETTSLDNISLQQLMDNSIVNLTVVDDWPSQQDRILGLRCAIMGDWNSGNERLAVEGREDGGDWEQIRLISGWAYSNSYNEGDSITRFGESDANICAEDGGWLDIETYIPNRFRDIRLRSRITGGTAYRHDIAFRSASLRNTNTPPIIGANVSLITSFQILEGAGAAFLRVINDTILFTNFMAGEVVGSADIQLIPLPVIVLDTEFFGFRVEGNVEIFLDNHGVIVVQSQEESIIATPSGLLCFARFCYTLEDNVEILLEQDMSHITISGREFFAKYVYGSDVYLAWGRGNPIWHTSQSFEFDVRPGQRYYLNQFGRVGSDVLRNAGLNGISRWTPVPGTVYDATTDVGVVRLTSGRIYQDVQVVPNRRYRLAARVANANTENDLVVALYDIGQESNPIRIDELRDSAVDSDTLEDEYYVTFLAPYSGKLRVEAYVDPEISSEYIAIDHISLVDAGDLRISDVIVSHGGIVYIEGEDYSVNYTQGTVTISDEGMIGEKGALSVVATVLVPTDTQYETGLIDEVGRRINVSKQYVYPHLSGEIYAGTGRYAHSDTPTRFILYEFLFDNLDADGEPIREVGLFADTQIMEGLPSGQRYFLPNQVEQEGTVLFKTNLDGVITRLSAVREQFSTVIGF